jgi:hypothetical protein
MSPHLAPRVALAFCLLAAACTQTVSSTSDRGTCVDSCPVPCNLDKDCDTAKGQLCCDYGGGSKACVDANRCPRFCSMDSMCQTMSGEACLRTTLFTAQEVCTQPELSIKTCSSDAVCKTGEKCCTIYKEPVCLATNLCPSACSASSDCNTANGEVCCTTFRQRDSTLAAPGLCVDPRAMTCPTTCEKSSDCRTQDGELCCGGVCSKSCPKECSQSSECVNQVCCKTTALKAPILGGKPGYLVPPQVVFPDFGTGPRDLGTPLLGCNGLRACIRGCTNPATSSTCIQACEDGSTTQASDLLVNIILCKFDYCSNPGTGDGGSAACDASLRDTPDQWSPGCSTCISSVSDANCSSDVAACTADRP